MSLKPPVTGYYQQTWKGLKSNPGLDIAVCFSGWGDVNQALNESAKKERALLGKKYCSIGGGNTNGTITHASLNAVDAAIMSGRFGNYHGICYDIEEGEARLSHRLEQSFSTAKRHGLKVLVTVSRSAPYNVPDAPALMYSLLVSKNVDYISPQLYGDGTKQEFTASWNYAWSHWKKVQVPVLVSIVNENCFNDAVLFFHQLGITPTGWIKWA